VKLVTKDQLSTAPYRQDECLDTVWAMALAAAERTENEVGLEKGDHGTVLSGAC
jgi:hypothetical protein